MRCRQIRSLKFKNVVSWNFFILSAQLRVFFESPEIWGEEVWKFRSAENWNFNLFLQNWCEYLNENNEKKYINKKDELKYKEININTN